MERLRELDDENSFATIPPTPGPGVVVHPLMRERVENSCDIGRSPQALAVDFPSLDLGHLDDIWWHADGTPGARGICVEPVASVGTRAAQFKAYLRARPERYIAVVGHGTFFFHLTSRTLANCEIAELDLYSGDWINSR
ncbi:MAG: hypothetical protein WKH97_13640 [Casimicrobiaceae bacterium]